MEDDWDLQAVVRGCTSTTTVTATATTTATTSASGVLRGCFPPLSMEEETESLLSFSDLFDGRNSFGELEELYKPFFPKMQPLSPQWIPTSSFLPHIGGLKDQPQQQQQQQQQRQTRQQPQPQKSPAASKRRKNQQKKVVRQVAAEGLSSDVWAWRKYGQKPIKGSPYPRGYYRCSSSKGCLARKQVERSRTDPAMFIITYTAEHNHPVPTHRNSLAGSTRQKVSTPQQAMTSDDPDTPTSKPSCSPISTTGLSPTTPLMASIEDEHVQQTKQDSKQDEEDAVIEENEEDLVIPDMEMTDDFFMGLDSLSEPIMTSAASPAFDDCFSDSFPDHLSSTFPPPWFANNPATAAGGV